MAHTRSPVAASESPDRDRGPSVRGIGSADLQRLVWQPPNVREDPWLRRGQFAKEQAAARTRPGNCSLLSGR